MALEKRSLEGYSELVMDWPAARNALGPAEAREIRLAIEEAGADQRCRAIVLMSSSSAFSSGGNLPEILKLVRSRKDDLERAIYGEFQGMARAIAASPVPIIAAVDGPAVGLGADLALACDVTFIGARGWLMQGWMAAGLIPATGGTYYVARRAGRQAVWKFLAGGRFGPEEADRAGLATATENAATAAHAMATTFAGMGREQIAAMRKLVAADGSLEEHLSTALPLQIGFLTQPAFEERANAMLKPTR